MIKNVSRIKKRIKRFYICGVHCSKNDFQEVSFNRQSRLLKPPSQHDTEVLVHANRRKISVNYHNVRFLFRTCSCWWKNAWGIVLRCRLVSRRCSETHQRQYLLPTSFQCRPWPHTLSLKRQHINNLAASIAGAPTMDASELQHP